jgi:hypothetical protein
LSDQPSHLCGYGYTDGHCDAHHHADFYGYTDGHCDAHHHADCNRDTDDSPTNGYRYPIALGYIHRLPYAHALATPRAFVSAPKWWGKS